ncbi:sensor histidine kinase [Gordonia alkaliphila]|uniref:Histidine kinase/HSP90-like ATPase domain-containing protein n=1 Tax=Gordonia alkaliphila TaxID=1053547 RepID=A0ABP8Z1M2_9ACTN
MTSDLRAAPRWANLDRVTRLFGLFVGVGYLGYLLMLAGPIADFASRMAGWWTPTIVVIVFGPGLLLVVVARRRPIRVLKAVSTTAALTYLAALASWAFAWTGPSLSLSEGGWLGAFPGLASLAAVVAWPVGWAVLHLVVGSTAVQLINYAARDGMSPTTLLLEIVFSIVFSSIFLGGAAMALRTGRVLDDTTEATHLEASTTAAQAARAVERERIDALIHDSVMATLLAASRPDGHGNVPELAAQTLAELDAIVTHGANDGSFTPGQALVYLRGAAADADVGAEFAVRADADDATPIPGAVVRTLGAAVAEALRNCVRHAGPAARRTIEGTVGSDALVVLVRDDGAGFDPARVLAQRLGIAVSIVGRMASLPGGSGAVESAPGAGTVVRLGWERE